MQSSCLNLFSSRDYRCRPSKWAYLVFMECLLHTRHGLIPKNRQGKAHCPRAPGPDKKKVTASQHPQGQGWDGRMGEWEGPPLATANWVSSSSTTIQKSKMKIIDHRVIRC